MKIKSDECKERWKEFKCRNIKIMGVVTYTKWVLDKSGQSHVKVANEMRAKAKIL